MAEILRQRWTVVASGTSPTRGRRRDFTSQIVPSGAWGACLVLFTWLCSFFIEWEALWSFACTYEDEGFSDAVASGASSSCLASSACRGMCDKEDMAKYGPRSNSKQWFIRKR